MGLQTKALSRFGGNLTPLCYTQKGECDLSAIFIFAQSGLELLQLSDWVKALRRYFDAQEPSTDPHAISEEILTVLTQSQTPVSKYLVEVTLLPKYNGRYLTEFFMARAKKLKLTLAEYRDLWKDSIAIDPKQWVELSEWELRLVRDTFQPFGQLSHWADYPMGALYLPFSYKALQELLEQAICTEYEKREQAIVRLVGPSTNEHEIVVAMLDEILSGFELEGNQNDAANRLKLRIHFYDKTQSILEEREKTHRELQKVYSWLTDKARFQYLDMTRFHDGWGENNTVLIIARNSLRRHAMDHGDFLRGAFRSLSTRGLFVTDPDTAFWMGGTAEDRVSEVGKMGTGDGESLIFRPY